jgi:predicted lipid-binding transport protein (Tim44 family)
VQLLELLIFAVLAAVVLYQLYAVLGRRVGRQPDEAAELAKRPPADSVAAARIAADPAAAGAAAELRVRDPAFDTDKFTAGAVAAFQTIVKAFAEGDRTALRPLLADVVYAPFETAIAQNEAEGRSGAVEFLQPPRADIEDVAVDGDLARIKVRFLAELRSRTKGPEGEAVDDRRTAELWTFERPLSSKDPNWILARVEAAEA